MFCTKCGKDIGSNERCLYCGKKIFDYSMYKDDEKENMDENKDDIEEVTVGDFKSSIISNKKFEKYISSEIIVAAICLLVEFSDIKIALVALAIVWFIDARDDKWLRQNSIKPFAVKLFATFICSVIRIFPDFVNWIIKIITLFNKYADFSGIDSFIGIFTDVVTFCEYIILMIMAVKALRRESYDISSVDSIIREHVK